LQFATTDVLYRMAHQLAATLPVHYK